jgi:hypothetical protein
MSNEEFKLTDENAKRIEAGQAEFYRLKEIVEKLQESNRSLREQVHLLGLDKVDLQRQILRANEEKDIALGHRDEAIAKASGLTTLLGMVQKVVNDFEAPKVVTAIANKNGSEVGSEAVKKALENFK